MASQLASLRREIYFEYGIVSLRRENCDSKNSTASSGQRVLGSSFLTQRPSLVCRMSIQPVQGSQIIGNANRLEEIGMLEDDPRSTLKLWRSYHTLDFLSTTEERNQRCHLRTSSEIRPVSHHLPRLHRLQCLHCLHCRLLRLPI